MTCQTSVLEPSKALPPTRMDTLRVLVTDDEPGMRLSVARVLRDFSARVPQVNGEVRFVVEQAETGEEALKQIACQTPDILLLDQRMPGISGMDVLEKLRQSEPDMLTVMITAYASIASAVQATKSGAYDFLPKPFTPQELKASVQKAAEHLILAREGRKLAEERRQVRFELIRVLGHELKAPIDAVQGYLELLRDPRRRANAAEADVYVERSLARIGGMRKLIDDLLDMTRIESGRKNRALALVDLRDVAQTVSETLAPEAAQHGVCVAIEGNADLLADRGEMEMLLNNLVSNAIKYNRSGGSVTISLARCDRQVRIAVSDTGIGMSADEQSRLFGEFVRIKNRQTRGVPGSGLGLSIVKKLVALYDGDVSVASTPNQGSTFTVVLQS